MSVIGIGTDIVEIERLTAMAEPVFMRLAERVLTPNELQRMASLKTPAAFLAKRWAGKEAAAKALGTGIADGVSFQHIEITAHSSGKPELELSERALELAKALGANQWHISLSDERQYATAFVVLSKA